MISYLGSKRRIIPKIQEIITPLPIKSACDLFGGTTRVGQALQSLGKYVISNDIAYYSEVFGHCYISTEAKNIDIAPKLAAIDVPAGPAGFFTKNYCYEARFYQEHNALRIDAIRKAIDNVATTVFERDILLTSLIEAAERVDSTAGVYYAYVKQWSPRSYNKLELRTPIILPGTGIVYRQDANDLVQYIDVDLTYIDCPYNGRVYADYYHFWDTLVLNDEPETKGIARRRIDTVERSTDYYKKKEALRVFSDLIYKARSPYILVSFSSEAFISREQVESVLAQKGYLTVYTIDNKRFAPAKIGLDGQRIVKTRGTHNQEYLFLVSPKEDKKR